MVVLAIVFGGVGVGWWVVGLGGGWWIWVPTKGVGLGCVLGWFMVVYGGVGWWNGGAMVWV